MSDIKQYLVTIHDDDMTIMRVELRTPSGMLLQLNEGEWGLQMDPGTSMHCPLKLPIVYEGKIPSLMYCQPFPVFNLSADSEETHYMAYHRGFRSCWNMITNWLKGMKL